MSLQMKKRLKTKTKLTPKKIKKNKKMMDKIKKQKLSK